MSGNRIGGIKARDANLASDPDFYRKIGKIGGQRGNTGGFASLIEGKDGLTGQDRARIAGAAGGRRSRRRKLATVADAPQMTQEGINVSVAAEAAS